MKPSSGIPRLAIIGRPNVGKSTLFNRIVGRRLSITEKRSGTTRDRVSAIVKNGSFTFELTDTGGFDMARKDRFSNLVRRQIEIALKKADIILFVCDVRDGVTPLDMEILPILRKTGSKIIIVVNKADNEKLKSGINEFYSFGIEELYPVSAIHNIGISELIEAVEKKIEPASESSVSAEAPVKVAIVGRPNVGKSSFLNGIIDEERVIVDEMPGTTRDSIDIYLNKNGTDIIFIDTAGMRHKRKIKDAVDVYGLLRARESVRRSDICAVIIDAYEGLTMDDMRIIKFAEESGKGCILMANKWDLVSGVEMSKYRDALVKKMDIIKGMPVLFMSCKTGFNINEAIPLIKFVEKNRRAKFPEEMLDGILENMGKNNRLPSVRSGKLINIRKIKQEETVPPTFSVFVNEPSSVSGDYIRGLKNILRNELSLIGAPIRINLRRFKK